MDLQPIYRIIMVTSPSEATFAKKFLVGSVTVGYNAECTAFAIDKVTAFVYPNITMRSTIYEIFRDPNLIKISARPFQLLKSYFRDIKYENCHLIREYISDIRTFIAMKHKLIDQDTVKDLSQRAATTALITMKYKSIADKLKKASKTCTKSYFNKKRDCYLHYLTAYNTILSQFGPMKFSDLLLRIRDYQQLCHVSLNPAMALEGLIKVNALSNDLDTTIVSIPDQIPEMN